VWLERHSAAVRRGGYLGDSWGGADYVDGVVGRFCAPHLGADGGAVALEIGPGGGRYTEKILPLVRELHAIDVSGEILAHLTERLGVPSGLAAHRGDGRTLSPIGDGLIDFAYSFNLFLFLDLETVHAYFAELRRVLRPSGIGVVQYADYSSEGGRRHFLANQSAWSAKEKPFGRFSFLTREFMERILETCGLAPAFHVTHGRDSFVGCVRRDGDALARHAAIAREAALPRRTETTPPGLDAAETAWWAEHAADAERIAWVQPESVRKRIRGHYVREIVRAVPRGGTVLDFGCGTGWLARLLASFGAESVVGVDDSPAQIEIARESIAGSPRAGKVRFLLGSDVPSGFRADVVVCHAVLHHLSWREIRGTLDAISRALVPGGTLFLLEPVAGTRPYVPWRLVPDALVRLFSDRGGSRRVSDAERALRQGLEKSRSEPRLPGRGPSPKEMPFRPGEIEARVGSRFRLVSVEPALFRAHHVAAENLLFSATYPRLGALLRGPALALASAWERMSLRRRPAGSFEGWVFCLYRFEKPENAGPVTEEGPTSTPG
jgi:SAM-dependent methyltransferase